MSDKRKGDIYRENKMIMHDKYLPATMIRAVVKADLKAQRMEQKNESYISNFLKRSSIIKEVRVGKGSDR